MRWPSVDSSDLWDREQIRPPGAVVTFTNVSDALFRLADVLPWSLVTQIKGKLGERAIEGGTAMITAQ